MYRAVDGTPQRAFEAPRSGYRSPLLVPFWPLAAIITNRQPHTGHDVYMTGAFSSGTLALPLPLLPRLDAISRRLAWSAVVALLVSNGPLFLCMPIIDDAALWNLHVQVFLDGGVPYRDVLETNPPGTLWLMTAIRWLLGPSSIALRTADLVILGTVILLLLQILRDVGLGKSVRIWTGAICLLFYFSISEWCHCQRDMWLMVASLGWLWLRARHIQRIAANSQPGIQVFGWSVVEGLVLGAGVWIKPMVLLPAAAAWLATTWWVRGGRRSLIDAAGLLMGGLLMGAGGAVWMQCSGVWPYFWETFLEWNPRYVAAGREHWTLPRFAGMVIRLFPWLLLHVPAIGLSAAALWRTCRPLAGRVTAAPRGPGCETAGIAPTRPSLVGAATANLVAVFYFGWLIQAFTLQHLFDYIHAPGVLLAILTCVVAASVRPRPSPAGQVAGVAFLLVALVCSPTLRWSRLTCWPECFRQGSSAEVRDRLTLMQFPNWRALERVAVYLRECGVRDGEVCCFPNSTIHLYEQLGIRPPTRYVYLENTLVFFPERRETLRAALAAAAPRYAITDLVAAGVPPEDVLPISPKFSSPAARLGVGPERVFPWEFPIVFRTGRYAVHRTVGPIRSLEVRPNSPLWQFRPAKRQPEVRDGPRPDAKGDTPAGRTST